MYQTPTWGGHDWTAVISHRVAGGSFFVLILIQNPVKVRSIQMFKVHLV